MAEEELSDDELAAQWAAMSEEGGETEGTNDRVLSQHEIDSLLGFDEAEEGEEVLSGLKAILNSAKVSYERLPMLEVAFDRLVRILSTTLRNFTSENVEVSLQGIRSIRFGEYLNSIPLPAMLTVFRAEEWDNSGLMTVDSSLIYSIVDVLLGARHGTPPMRIEGRPYTTIERSLVQRLVELILSSMSKAFEPLSKVNFRFDRLETNPGFAAIARPGNAAIVVRMRVDMDERGGLIEILLPLATLEPVREILLQMFLGEKLGRDSIWETHLVKEIWNTQIPIDAVLDEVEVPLQTIMEWKRGDQLMLDVTPQSLVQVRCGDIPIFRGKMGRKAGHVALQVEETFIGRKKKDDTFPVA